MPDKGSCSSTSDLVSDFKSLNEQDRISHKKTVRTIHPADEALHRNLKPKTKPITLSIQNTEDLNAHDSSSALLVQCLSLGIFRN